MKLLFMLLFGVLSCRTTNRVPPKVDAIKVTCYSLSGNVVYINTSKKAFSMEFTIDSQEDGIDFDICEIQTLYK